MRDVGQRSAEDISVARKAFNIELDIWERPMSSSKAKDRLDPYFYTRKTCLNESEHSLNRALT